MRTSSAASQNSEGENYHRDLISCQAACPVHTDARGYVRAIAAGRFIGEHLSVLAEPLVAALPNYGVRHLELAGAVLLRRVGPRPQAEK